MSTIKLSALVLTLITSLFLSANAHSASKVRKAEVPTCEAMANWVAPLKKKYPNSKFKGVYEDRIKDLYKFLFEDKHFTSIFGQPFDQLSDKSLNYIARGLSYSRKNCVNYAYLISIYPDAFLTRPFNKELRGTPFSYNFVKSHINSIRQFSKKATKKTNSKKIVSTVFKSPDDLSGWWAGLTRCFSRGKSYEVYLDVEENPKIVNNGKVYRGELRINGVPNRQLEKMEIKISAKNDGQIYIESQGSMIFIRSYKRVTNRAGGLILTLETRQKCSTMYLVNYHRFKADSDVCWMTYLWVGMARDKWVDGHNLKRKYPRILKSYNPDSAFYHTLVSDRLFKKMSGRDLSSLSDKELAMSLDHIDLCTIYSDRKWQLGEIFEKINYGGIPVARARSMNARQKAHGEKLKTLLAKAKAMEDSLDNIEPLKKLHSEYIDKVMDIPDRTHFKYLEALSERLAGLEDMARLAKKHGLKKIPKLPLDSTQSSKVTPDDEKLPAVTPKKIEDQKTTIDINPDVK